LTRIIPSQVCEQLRISVPWLVWRLIGGVSQPMCWGAELEGGRGRTLPSDRSDLSLSVAAEGAEGVGLLVQKLTTHRCHNLLLAG